MNNKDNLLKIEVNEENSKLGDYLRYTSNLSSRFIRKSAKNKKIQVNGITVTLAYQLKSGDVITVNLDKEETQDIIPEKMDLNIVYEDQDIIVINKPKGIVVHPTKRFPQGTLANGLLYYFQEKGERSIVRLVNRLDMNTSGLVIIAKNAYSHMSLSRDMERDDFVKSYLTVVHGNLDEKSGVIDKPIYRVGEGTIKRIIDERGQRSITHFEVIESYKNADLVKLVLETGRTHQIRVHLSSIEHPIYGDELYGEKEEEYIDRQALHAYKLQFPHPKDGRILTLETEIPLDIQNLILKLK